MQLYVKRISQAEDKTGTKFPAFLKHFNDIPESYWSIASKFFNSPTGRDSSLH